MVVILFFIDYCFDELENSIVTDMYIFNGLFLSKKFFFR